MAAASTGTFYGQAAGAELNAPSEVAANGGNLVIAGTGSNRIRVVTGG